MKLKNDFKYYFCLVTSHCSTLHFEKGLLGKDCSSGFRVNQLVYYSSNNCAFLFLVPDFSASTPLKRVIISVYDFLFTDTVEKLGSHRQQVANCDKL